GIDVRNVYMFRGVRQDDTGTITWPSAEVGLRLHAADRGLTSARIRVGTFNSLHSGWAGSDGPSSKRWYESDIYSTLSLAFGVAAPVKVGLSLGNYYELSGKDHAFGFASIAGIATLPLTRNLSVHGGVEYQRLGTTTKTFNGGEASKTIASVGVGLTR